MFEINFHLLIFSPIKFWMGLEAQTISFRIINHFNVFFGNVFLSHISMSPFTETTKRSCSNQFVIAYREHHLVVCAGDMNYITSFQVSDTMTTCCSMLVYVLIHTTTRHYIQELTTSADAYTRNTILLQQVKQILFLTIPARIVVGVVVGFITVVSWGYIFTPSEYSQISLVNIFRD